MTHSLAVRQAVTIRPRPTVHLLARTGILMARIHLSPPAGSVPDPLHPCAPPRTHRHSLQPLLRQPQQKARLWGTGHGGGGLRAGSCRSLPRKTRYLTPGARPLGTLGEGQGWCGD